MASSAFYPVLFDLLGFLIGWFLLTQVGYAMVRPQLRDHRAAELLGVPE